jgi:hypothetical protein
VTVVFIVVLGGWSLRPYDITLVAVVITSAHLAPFEATPMTTEQQFWWNWAVGLAGVAANLLVVAVALFGERFWSWKFPPKFRMRLLEKLGEKTVAVGLRDGVPIRNDVRFFHLLVWNERRKWSPAHGVQVFLTSIEELGPNDKYQVAWVGNVPMRWRDQEVVPITETIGAPKHADFFMVGKQNLMLSLMPLITPNNLNVHRKGACRFVARFQARSNEADSEDFRIEVAWDGVWEDGNIEMGNHLRVEQKA